MYHFIRTAQEKENGKSGMKVVNFLCDRFIKMDDQKESINLIINNVY